MSNMAALCHIFSHITKQNFQIYLVPGGMVGSEEPPSQIKVHLTKSPPFEMKGPLFKTKGLQLYITTP